MRRSSVLFLFLAALLSACGSSYSPGPSGGGTVGHDSVTVGNSSFSPKNVAPDDTGLVVWTWNSAAIAGRFTRIGREAKRKRAEYTQEICGPALTVCGLGLLLILATVIPA